MEEITIPFRHVKADDLQGPDDYYQVVHDVYTARYLEGLGVQPTDFNRRIVARHAPLASCQIEAAWGSRHSVVTDQLRIVQPKIEPTVAAPKTKLTSEAISRNSHAHSRVEQEHIEYMSCEMPNNPAAQTLQEIEDKESIIQRALSEKFMISAMSAMRTFDHAASECGDTALAEELEWVRAQVRPTNPKDDALKETGMEHRDRLEKELEKLKQKFILPYACARPKPGRGTRVVPWQHLQSSQSIAVSDEMRSEALAPIKATLHEILDESRDYASLLPLELLTSRDEPALFEAVRAQLVFSEAVRLTGLLAHLLYWIVFKHLHPEEKQLPETSQQALQVTVHELWSALIAPYRDFPMGVSLVMPAFSLAIKRGMHWIFTSRYPSVFNEATEPALCQQLAEQINVLFMQLFDPDCVYARFGVLDSTQDAIKLWRKFDLALASKGQGIASRMITRKNRTTPAMNTLMGAECFGRPTNAKTRKLLAKSASDSSVRIGSFGCAASKASRSPGPTKVSAKARSPGPSQANKPQMDELKQGVLFKVACKQMSHSVLPSGPGKATAERAVARAASTGRLSSAATEGNRRRHPLRALGGPARSPVRDRRPTTLELMQSVGHMRRP